MNSGAPTSVNEIPTTKQAWAAATQALLQARETRSDADKTRAVEQLYSVAVTQARLHILAKVDQFVPTHARRDAEVMAHEVVGSLLVGNLRMSVLIDKFDPDRGTLRTLFAACIRNKVIDHVRRDPTPGIVGPADRPTIGTTDTPTEAPEAAPERWDMWERECSLLTVGSAYAPAGPARASPEAAYEDDHTSRELLERLDRLLTEGEREALYFELAEYSGRQAVDALNKKHGNCTDAFGKEHPYISETTYRRRLDSVRRKFQAEFPEITPG